MISALKSVCRKVVMADFKVLYQHLPGGVCE